MEILNATEVGFVVDDDLLNFALDVEAEEDEDTKTIFKGASSSSSSLKAAAAEAAELAFGHETRSGLFPGFVEEELEWLSNKDAFPSVETCFGILSDNPELVLNRQSPVSVLENSSSSSSDNSSGNGSTVASCLGSLKVPGGFPVRPRSKRRRGKRTPSFGELPDQQPRLSRVSVKSKQESSVLFPPVSTTTSSGSRMGRRCLHCQVDKTPQWRAGPMGPKTLCNACGVRYKSGRLLPEYRPANSPTFSSALHSNSHRKVVEMRRQKYPATATGGATMDNEAYGYSVE